MGKRIPISKKLRFEVYKRDKFTCQYCGRKSPDIVLNVDHINPVDNEGDNNILNLITSCFDCNNGKRAILLSDDSILEKQRDQLELLEERREQIEFMVEWRKSLLNLDNDIINMISDYINTKLINRSVNESGKTNIRKWIKKYDIEKITEAIDISFEKYIKYEKGIIIGESVDDFFSKVSGILLVKSLPPIQQKLIFVKKVASNRFNYWNKVTASILLSNYVKSLGTFLTEDEIINDITVGNLMILTKSAKHWSEWKTTIENWIEEQNTISE